MKKFYLLLLAVFMAFNISAEINIIPKPQSVTPAEGSFSLSKAKKIAYTPGLGELAQYLADVVSGSTGMDLYVTPNVKGADIILKTDGKKVSAAEGYVLEVTPDKIVITGADKGGVFYGIQSLLQMFPPQIYSQRRVKGVEWTAPCVTVIDSPARPYRGMLLDVARYFHDKDYVKHFIDMMATYKMNKLQFHLIDDSGWRLESEKYPKLVEMGAYSGDNAHRLGGYYTKDDIKELIDYAALRNVEIIPEIEFPAHILSAIVAYPWLSCTGQQHELPSQHFISEDLLCVGKDSAIVFLFDILDEVTDLFPSKYLNIGGDEAVYTRWKECERCLALMEREGLSEVSQLQGWLTDTVARVMANKNIKVIGWEEIITRGDVSTPVVALTWHNVADTIIPKSKGHQSILTPATHTYFDFPEYDKPGEVQAATWLPPIPIEKVYSMHVNDYSPQSAVIGVQGCLWSDQFIHGTVLQELQPLNENRSETYIDYLTFPRLTALSEVAWTNEKNRSWNDFRDRLYYHYPKLDNKGINYRVPEPLLTDITVNADTTVSFRLKPTVEGSEIRYTVDGTYPTIHSTLYDGSVMTVPEGAVFYASTVVNGKRVSLPVMLGQNPE